MVNLGAVPPIVKCRLIHDPRMLPVACERTGSGLLHEWLESHPLYCLTNSTRRFRARPASVSLVATGAKEATPLASRRLALIL